MGLDGISWDWMDPVLFFSVQTNRPIFWAISFKAAELRGESSMLNHGVTWLTSKDPRYPGTRGNFEILLREGVAGEHRNLEKIVFFFRWIYYCIQSFLGALPASLTSYIFLLQVELRRNDS